MAKVQIEVCASKANAKRLEELGVPECRHIFLCDKDNGGIDNLNPWYCEATALYWIWKKSKAKVVGLEHYRRFFVNRKGRFLPEDEILSILKDNDIVLAEHYYDMTNNVFPRVAQSVVIGWGNRKFQAYKFIYGFLLHLAKTGMHDFAKFVMEDLYDEQTFYKCNMFISKKSVITEWCELMFPKVDEWLKEDGIKLDGSNLRLIGYVFEHLFGSWCKWRKLKIKVCDIVIYNKVLGAEEPAVFSNLRLLRKDVPH